MPELVSHLLAPIRALGRPWITERAERLEEAVRKFHAAPSDLVAAFGGAVVVQLTIVGFYLLAARGLAIPLPLLLGAVLIPVSLVIQLAPVSINGFGVRRSGFCIFLCPFWPSHRRGRRALPRGDRVGDGIVLDWRFGLLRQTTVIGSRLPAISSQLKPSLKARPRKADY